MCFLCCIDKALLFKIVCEADCIYLGSDTPAKIWLLRHSQYRYSYLAKLLRLWSNSLHFSCSSFKSMKKPKEDFNPILMRFSKQQEGEYQHRPDPSFKLGLLCALFMFIGVVVVQAIMSTR